MTIIGNNVNQIIKVSHKLSRNELKQLTPAQRKVLDLVINNKDLLKDNTTTIKSTTQLLSRLKDIKEQGGLLPNPRKKSITERFFIALGLIPSSEKLYYDLHKNDVVKPKVKEDDKGITIKIKSPGIKYKSFRKKSNH